MGRMFGNVLACYLYYLVPGHVSVRNITVFRPNSCDSSYSTRCTAKDKTKGFSMADEEDKTVIVEKDRSSSGPVVAIIVLVVLILLVLFGLPYLGGGGGGAPTPVESPTPTTGQ